MIAVLKGLRITVKEHQIVLSLVLHVHICCFSSLALTPLLTRYSLKNLTGLWFMRERQKFSSKGTLSQDFSVRRNTGSRGMKRAEAAKSSTHLILLSAIILQKLT